MNKIRIGSIISLVICYSFTSFSQLKIEQPETGKKIPDFTFTNVNHYSKPTLSISDFRGKWLFLDFWSTNCISCIHAFPKVSALRKKFSKKLEWVMIGYKLTNDKTQEFYEKLRLRQNLELITVYDSLLFNTWGIQSVPHIIIIDPDGVVNTITPGRDITEDKINELLTGRDVSFYPNETAMKSFDPAGVRKSDLIYRSMISKWNHERLDTDYVLLFDSAPKDVREKGFNLSMEPLHELFNQAYIGRWQWMEIDSLYRTIYPIHSLEVNDSSLFEYNFSDYNSSGLYNYSLVAPAERMTSKNIMIELQNDLQRVFGMRASFERRMVPVWELQAKSSAYQKLKTHGGEPFRTEGSIAAGFSARNISSTKFLGNISMYIHDGLPFFDATGFSGNIDVTMDTDMTKVQNIQKELLKSDMSLIKVLRPMMVMVIKESPIHE